MENLNNNDIVLVANIIGKPIQCKIIDANYNDTMVEVEIIEGTFKNQYTTASKENIVNMITKTTKDDINVQALKIAMDNNNIDSYSIHGFDYGFQIVIEGSNYNVYVDVFNEEYEEIYSLSTMNTNIHYEGREYDIYFDHTDMFKNNCNRKNIKSVISYIEKYI